MKNLFVLFFLFFIAGATVLAQAPDWQWAKSAGGSVDDRSNSIALDGSGNIYVTGYFASSTITLGSTILTNASANNADIFIVKYNSSSNVLWAKSAGGSGNDEGYGIVVDGNGNSYVTGTFGSSTITFGSTTLINSSGADIFIVKYDNSGNALWAKNSGGSGGGIGNSIAADGTGNIYVTGYFGSPNIAFGSTTLANAGGADVFIAKYSPLGNVLWAKSAGGYYDDYGNGIAVDGSGNSYFTGSFNSLNISFGSDTLTNVAGGTDVFITKYSTSGNTLWAKSAGLYGFVEGTSIAVDGGGNSYVTGRFDNPIIFGSDTLISINVSTTIFIAKFSPSGNALWAKSAGGSGQDKGNSIAVDGSGNSYVTGYFISSTITFGSDTLTNAGIYSDILIAKYSPLGNVLWAKSVGGSNWDEGNSIAVNGSGYSYVTGFFGSPTLILGATTLMNNGGNNIFIAKLGNSPGFIGETNNENDVNISPNPTTGKFTINNSENISSIEIYNVLGERIYKSPITQLPNHPITIDISSHPKGIYFIKLREGEKNYSGKIVLQ